MFGHNDDDDKSKQGATVDPVVPDDTSTPIPDGGLDLPATHNDHDDQSHDDFLDTPGTTSTPTTPKTPVADDELLKLKRDALEELVPLVDHLQQSAEEKFKTTMMMIQATDDSALVKLAYQAAKDIPDDKVRAQALLDIVNEINYFTQQHTGPVPA